MSASQYKAALIINTNQVFYFSTLRSIEGGPIIDPKLIQEELTGNGADGSRWRDRNLQFSEWIFETSADAANEDITDQLVAAYRTAQNQGAVGKIRLERNGIYRTYVGLKIIDVETKQRGGTSIGFGAETTSNALLYATWRTKFVAVQRT